MLSFPLEWFVLDAAIPSNCLSSLLDCLTKFLYNVPHPSKSWRILSYNMMQFLTESRLVVLIPLLRYLTFDFRSIPVYPCYFRH